MSPQWWNRLIVASCALAAAGILACGFAVLHVLTPIGSILDFLAGVVLLALVVVGVMIGYSWICEKCEDLPEERLDRILAAGKANRPGAGESWRRPEAGTAGDRPDARDAPQQFRSRGQEWTTLRGFVPSNAAKPYAVRARHGQ
jgi:hypothetical protein